MKRISFEDFCLQMNAQGGTVSGPSFRLTNTKTGDYLQSTTIGQNFSVTTIKAALIEDHLIKFNAPYLPHAVNMCFNLEGTLETHFETARVSATLQKGTQHFNYVPAKEYELLIKKQLHCVHIAIDLNYYIKLLGGSEQWSDELKTKLLAGELCLSNQLKVDASIKRILLEMQDNTYVNHLRELFFEAKILELITIQLHQQNSLAAAPGTLNKKDRALFQDLRSHIDDSFTKEHSLRSLSRTFGINEFKLKQGFRRAFGTSVFNYIHEKKMSYALTLIRDDGKSITDVAGIVGYKNPNHFSTAFKKKYGVTPSALR